MPVVSERMVGQSVSCTLLGPHIPPLSQSIRWIALCCRAATFSGKRLEIVARPGEEQEGALAVRPPCMFQLISDTEDVSRLANVPIVLTAFETIACQITSCLNANQSVS